MVTDDGIYIPGLSESMSNGGSCDGTPEQSGLIDWVEGRADPEWRNDPEAQYLDWFSISEDQSPVAQVAAESLRGFIGIPIGGKGGITKKTAALFQRLYGINIKRALTSSGRPFIRLAPRSLGDAGAQHRSVWIDPGTGVPFPWSVIEVNPEQHPGVDAGEMGGFLVHEFAHWAERWFGVFGDYTDQERGATDNFLERYLGGQAGSQAVGMPHGYRGWVEMYYQWGEGAGY